MNQTGMIVSIVAIAGCLVLALRNSEIRSLQRGRALRLMAIWAAIIIGLVLLLQTVNAGVGS
ncbi:hypothetical protein GR702_09165 [Novosphingobium sp. FGD1]|jgi:hypothetical protein|uniref:Uncharacterized protein n=1 Tax=Novosphingobium silvae TaxID=2692619 RepID=A0A7X4GGN6_9SPHN|nr:hypothetical protein [Novosphingobium silvae]MYL97939.1 hypothetical protein [Novosphingobium silvae]